MILELPTTPILEKVRSHPVRELWGGTIGQGTNKERRDDNGGTNKVEASEYNIERTDYARRTTGLIISYHRLDQ